MAASRSTEPDPSARYAEVGPLRDYLMRWVDVPPLEVSSSEQHHEPLSDGFVSSWAGDFLSAITFDPQGFVVTYHGIASRS